MNSSLRSLSFALPLAWAIIAAASAAEVPAAEKTVALKGQHVTVHFRPADWQQLQDKKEFSGFLDQVYRTMAELTRNEPPMLLRGYQDLGAWGTAALDGVNIDWSAVPGLLTDFNSGKVEFGLIHEMGHVFDARDFPRWYITPSCGGETFANIKLSYAVDRLLRADTRYRIEFGPGGRQTGVAFNDRFYLDAGKAYLAAATPWQQMSVDDLHAFHLKLIRRFGWDVYKKWFRAYPLIEAQPDGRAPAETDNPLRMQLICALLSRFSGENLVPYFQQWRIPVTDADVAAVTTRYQLDRVAAEVDRQFAREFAKGGIHLDPLSLAIRPTSSPTATAITANPVQVSISNIFGNLNGVEVRYTLDGSPAGATATRFTGKPFEVPAGATVRAALIVPGQAATVLEATWKAPAP